MCHTRHVNLEDMPCAQASRYECVTEDLFSYFSPKNYVVGTQRNYLGEMVLLSWVMDKKIMTILRSKHLLTVVPTKSDSDVIFCLQLLSKTLTCTHHLMYENR